jgi:Gamma-glutamyl cyclotransferase, AIG2-like
MNEPGDRRIDTFFYGLFMDIEILNEAGVRPLNPRKAYVDDFALRIGQRATLIPSTGNRTYGMIFALTHSKLERLYNAPGLTEYRSEAVLVHLLDGTTVAALCYNLLKPPKSKDRNPDYAAKLQRILTKLSFPPEYISSIS